MDRLSVEFVIPKKFAEGIKNGTLERVGGIIRDSQTKRIVAWLRETQPNASLVSPLLGIGANASIINLGVTVIGFAIITHRLNELEKRLQEYQKILDKINRKIDLGYYARFRAAIDLARDAFKIKNHENRKGIAIEAISKFKEIDHIYTDYTDKELEERSKIAGEYISTLVLAYIAETRCYLELESPEAALDRLEEGAAKLRPRIQRYIDILLTSNPAAYLQPQYKGKINLRRLTRIYQWLDPTLGENAVFEIQRDNFVEFSKDPDKWAWSLPPAILDRTEVPWGWFGPDPVDLKREATKRLPKVLEAIESTIETHRRFQSFQTEIWAIQKLGISFQEWLKLNGLEDKPNGVELIYIVPS